jgi:hypothetical protein
MSDKQLLIDAAKASGFEYTKDENPLESDSLALRLAVKLQIPLQFPDWKNITRTWGSESNPDAFDEPHDNDPYAATRRAIVRAAAEIGKAMK